MKFKSQNTAIVSMNEAIKAMIPTLTKELGFEYVDPDDVAAKYDETSKLFTFFVELAWEAAAPSRRTIILSKSSFVSDLRLDLSELPGSGTEVDLTFRDGSTRRVKITKVDNEGNLYVNEESVCNCDDGDPYDLVESISWDAMERTPRSGRPPNQGAIVIEPVT